MKQSVYRPFPYGSAKSLLHARSTGHYIVHSGWHDSAIRKNFIELYWGVAGECIFTHEKHDWLLHQNEVCFFLPGDAHIIQSGTTGGEYYWMTFDGPHLEFIIKTFDLKREARPAGNCPVELFLRLQRELRDLSQEGEYRAGGTCYEILSISCIGAEPEENQAIVRFKELVEDHFSDVDFGVEDAAQILGIHRTTLHRLVMRHSGMPPTDYLNSFRIQEAIKLLIDSNYSIKEIAADTGFRDQNYFTKVIMKRFGKTPSQLRRHE